MAEPFVVGSQDRIAGTIYDRQGTSLVTADLSTASVALKASLNSGAASTWTCTVDPDQVTNRGQFYYDLKSTDIAAIGTLRLQAHVTIGSSVYKSRPVTSTVLATL